MISVKEAKLSNSTSKINIVARLCGHISTNNSLTRIAKLCYRFLGTEADFSHSRLAFCNIEFCDHRL